VGDLPSRPRCSGSHLRCSRCSRLFSALTANHCDTPRAGGGDTALAHLTRSALLMFPAFVALVAVRAAVSDHRLKTAAAGASVLIGGLGLSTFFWLPALLERDSVKTDLLRTGFLNWTNL